MRLQILSIASLISLACFVRIAACNERVEAVFEKLADHSFHPLNEDHSFTNDRDMGKHGIADLDDADWRIRSLAIRDLLLELPSDAPAVRSGLEHVSHHVRQITAAVLAIDDDTLFTDSRLTAWATPRDMFRFKNAARWARG